MCNIQASKTFWNERNDCYKATQELRNLPSEENKPTAYYTLHTKRQDEVLGTGIQCSKEKYVHHYQNWLGLKYVDFSKENVYLSRSDCSNMREDKNCETNKMICEGSNCFYIPKFEPDFPVILGTNKIITYECHLSNRIISAKKSTDLILGANCKAIDKYCILHDSTVIWDQSIIHSCPFKAYKVEEFTQQGELLINANNNVFYKINKKREHACGLSFYTTEEGVYLTEYNSSKRANLELSQLNITQKNLTESSNDNTQLEVAIKTILANIDYNQFQNRLINLSRKRDSCLRNYAFMLAQKFHDDKFFRTFNNGKEEIWYTTQNRILIPQCTQVEGVQITTKTNECYVDLPVTFIIKQTRMVGFLNDENIIVSQSKKSNCKAKKFYVFENFIVEHEGKTASYATDYKLKSVESFIEFNRETDYHHSDLILNGLNSITEHQFIEKLKKARDSMQYTMKRRISERTKPLITFFFFSLSCVQSLLQ